MEREEVWDLYFSRLYRLLVSERAKVEDLIRKEVKEDISKRWKDVNGDRVEAYIEIAISFLDERLRAYSMDYLDRFLEAATYGASLEDLASTASLDWYDWHQEKEEIDAKIETGLNLMQTPEDTVDELLDQFGAFPNKSIIQQYQQKPEKNYLPDHVLAIAMQRVIDER